MDSGLVYVECRTKLILVLDYRSLTRLLNTVGDKTRRKSRKERPLYNTMNKWKIIKHNRLWTNDSDRN